MRAQNVPTFRIWATRSGPRSESGRIGWPIEPNAPADRRARRLLGVRNPDLSETNAVSAPPGIPKRPEIASLRARGEVAESGRTRLIRNQVYLHGYRGFESHPLRHGVFVSGDFRRWCMNPIEARKSALPHQSATSRLTNLVCLVRTSDSRCCMRSALQIFAIRDDEPGAGHR